jgi:hypothetical protein
MSDEYLWNRSGPPDLEIERLERLLAPLRQGGPVLRQAPPRRPLWLAAAAALVLAAVGLMRFGAPSAPATAWEVAKLQGSARVGGRNAAVAMPVRTGQALQTGNASGLTLQADEVGRVDLGPDSELSAAANSRLLLRRGTLHAYIWAPPRQFVVDTPAARAVDLGCEYTVTVNASGDGLLQVSYGWVAFQFEDRESFIPADAECVTRRSRGPGIPYYADAPPSLREALDRFERGGQASLDGVLASARPRDGLTLWHLLTRVSAPDRGRVFDRFAQLVPLPAEVSREGALRKDAHTLDLCWNALNLESTDWWRGWERRW